MNFNRIDPKPKLKHLECYWLILNKWSELYKTITIGRITFDKKTI